MALYIPHSIFQLSRILGGTGRFILSQSGILGEHRPVYCITESDFMGAPTGLLYHSRILGGHRPVYCITESDFKGAPTGLLYHRVGLHSVDSSDMRSNVTVLLSVSRLGPNGENPDW